MFKDTGSSRSQVDPGGVKPSREDRRLDLDALEADLAQMAAACSVDMTLWDRFSNGVLRLISDRREAAAENARLREALSEISGASSLRLKYDYRGGMTAEADFCWAGVTRAIARAALLSSEDQPIGLATRSGPETGSTR